MAEPEHLYQVIVWAHGELDHRWPVLRDYISAPPGYDERLRDAYFAKVPATIRENPNFGFSTEVTLIAGDPQQYYRIETGAVPETTFFSGTREEAERVRNEVFTKRFEEYRGPTFSAMTHIRPRRLEDALSMTYEELEEDTHWRKDR